MNQTFIDMLVAIKDPAAIEKAYNIMAAKRALLAQRKAEKTVKFAHTDMEPRPLFDTKCPDMVDLKRMTAPVHEGYKLMPSPMDIINHNHQKGEFLIRLKDVTPMMTKNGFYNGMVMKLLKSGYEASTLRHVRSGRVAVIHNRHLESFFKPT
ncbi:MAG: hypothetical protein ACRC7S_10085 [Cetobacterium sp.]